MVHFRRKTVVWLWIAALLTATTGVSMQRIYCYCLGQTSVSLFDVQHPCEASDRTAAAVTCCPQKEVPGKSCCATVEANDPTLGGLSLASNKPCPGISDAGCTHKTTYVFQLHTEYVQEKQAGFEADYPLWFKEMPLLRHFTRSALCVSDGLPRYPKPPPISGRDRCVRHQVYRC